MVSIAAGVTLDQLARALGHDRKIVRAMPNTPSLVNAGTDLRYPERAGHI